jgi:hypothetical protein
MMTTNGNYCAWATDFPQPWIIFVKSVFRYTFPLCLVLASMPAPAEQSARALLDKARDYVASAPTIRRVDTSEQSIAAIVDQRRVEQEPQTNVVTIEIERSKLLARQTAAIQGKPLIMLKQGEKAAMKLGAGPWEIPTGPFENMAKDMGNLFVCEVETPESEKNAPTWKLTGTELLGGQKAFVIETEGNTAVSLAQERMAKGIAKVFSGNPAQRPTIKVLEYSSKHWISTSDYRHLQAIQISKVQMTIALPNGKQQLIEQTSKATSRYSFEKVAIEIPAEAQKVLSLGVRVE